MHAASYREPTFYTSASYLARYSEKVQSTVGQGQRRMLLRRQDSGDEHDSVHCTGHFRNRMLRHNGIHRLHAYTGHEPIGVESGVPSTPQGCSSWHAFSTLQGASGAGHRPAAP